MPVLSAWTRLTAAGALIAAGLATAAPALAAGCPADKVTTSGPTSGPTEPKGVEDTVISSIDLGTESIAQPGRNFRLRKLVIQPGGIVPWHSHGDRPAIIYIISGNATEYSSTCSVPIEHAAGDVTAETHTTSHWWKNNGNEPAVLLSADILHDDKDKHTM